MRQVNQPDVLPNRFLKSARYGKSLIRNTLLMRAACWEEMLRSQDSSIVVAQQDRQRSPDIKFLAVDDPCQNERRYAAMFEDSGGDRRKRLIDSVASDREIPMGLHSHSINSLVQGCIMRGADEQVVRSELCERWQPQECCLANVACWHEAGNPGCPLSR